MNQRINSLVLACGVTLVATGVQALADSNPDSASNQPPVTQPTPALPAATPVPADAPAAPTSVGDDELLAGPKVGEDSKQPQEHERMRARAGERGVRDNLGVAMRFWYGTLSQVGLTEEQKKQIDPIKAEYNAARDAFEKEHGEKLTALREQMRAARQDGKQVPKEVVQEWRKLHEQGPKVELYQERIWALLTTEQQKLFTEKLNAAQKLARERGMNRTRPGEDGMQPSGDPDDPAAKERRARREQLRKEREQQNPSEPAAPTGPAPVEQPATPATPGTDGTSPPIEPGGSNQTP